MVRPRSACMSCRHCSRSIEPAAACLSPRVPLAPHPSGSWWPQEVLVEEAVAALDAYGRGALSDGSQAVLSSSAAGLAQAGLQALGPLRPFLLPFPTPLEVLSRHARPFEADEACVPPGQGLHQSQPWLPAGPHAAGQDL